MATNSEVTTAITTKLNSLTISLDGSTYQGTLVTIGEDNCVKAPKIYANGKSIDTIQYPDSCVTSKKLYEKIDLGSL